MTEDKALEMEEATNLENTEEAIQEKQEKMLPVSRVEQLIKKAKLKGRDAMLQEVEALKAENELLKKSAGSMGGMAIPVDEEAITQKILDKIHQQFQENSEKMAQEELEKEAKKIADSYHAKMSIGKDNFADFEEVMADFNPAAFPNLVFLASQVDNTPALMYEIMKNPSKLATLAVMSERDPRAAQNMINRISSSIKANEQAKAEEQNVPDPLRRLSSSPIGQDSGEPSLRDFKAKYLG